jgi:hypothetical protein
MSQKVSAASTADRVYGRAATGASTAEEMVGALSSVCAALSRTLAAVMGDVGFRVAFTRSLAKARGQYPFLAHGEVASGDAFLEPLWAALRQQPPTVIREVAISLLGTFFDLLFTLIGEGVTKELLHDTWPDAFPRTASSSERS